MKKNLTFIMLSSIILLSACSEPVFDASTKVARAESFKIIYDSLPDKEKEQFKQAYASIVFSYLNHVAFKEKGDSKEVVQERINLLMNGVNASQLIEEYRKVRIIRGSWEIQQIEKNILEVKENKKQLNQVTIDQYELYAEKDGALDRMFLEAIIYNGSKYKLSSAVFTIRVGSSYSDTLSLQKRSIYFEFPDNLEPKSKIVRNIDLGPITAHRYLPQNPIISEYSTSRISGEGIDISANIYPTLSALKKRLMKKKEDYQNEFNEGVEPVL